MTDAKSPHNPAAATHSPGVATAGTAPGDPDLYVQAWVSTLEDSPPDLHGVIHQVPVSRLGWMSKVEINAKHKELRKGTNRMTPQERIEYEEEQAKKEEEERVKAKKELHK